jgi:hypothetical protein
MNRLHQTQLILQNALNQSVGWDYQHNNLKTKMTLIVLSSNLFDYAVNCWKDKLLVLDVILQEINQ